jgi:adhesin transport system membrane fusion protein
MVRQADVLKLSSTVDSGAKSSALPVKAAILQQPSFYVWFVAGSVTTLLLWLSIAPIDRVVRLDGSIIPAGRNQQIQHLEGGIVASIAVNEGDSVKKDDLLVTITSKAAEATLSETMAKLTTLRLRAARLQTEARGDTVLNFPDDLAKNSGAGAERALYEQRQARLSKDMQVHRQIIEQNRAALTEAASRQQKLLEELGYARKRSQLMTGLAASNAASQMEVLDAKSREGRLNTELVEAESLQPKLKAAIAEQQARIEALAAEQKTTAQNDLVVALAEIEQLSQNQTAETDRVQRTEIRAPVSGVVNRLAVNTVGGVVKPGESIIEITPDADMSLIEGKIEPKDRGDMLPGLPAKIRVTAYDAAELGQLDGKVIEISADTVRDAHGDPFYRVKLLIPTLPPNYREKPLRTGMTVTADIVTGRRTIMHHLLAPLSKFSNRVMRDSK